MSTRVKRLTVQTVLVAALLGALPAVASAATLDISAPASVRSDQTYSLSVTGTTERKASVTVYEDSDTSRPCAATPLDEDARSTARLVFFQEAREGSFSYARDISPGFFTIVVEDSNFEDQFVDQRSPTSGQYKLCGYLLFTTGNNPPPDATDSQDITFVPARPDLTSTPNRTTEATRARFRFSGGSRFECRLDGAGFRSCSSPKRYRNLDVGRHVFRVRAVFPDGGRSGVRTFRWRITK